MKSLPWLFLLLALGGAIWIARGVLGNARTEPADLLASARARLERSDPDFDGAQRELSTALRLIAPGESPELVEELLLERARLLRRRQVPDGAANDLETLLELGASNPDAVRMELGWVELDRQRFDAAVQCAEEVLGSAPKHSNAHVLRATSFQRRARLLETELEVELLEQLPAERADALLPNVDRMLHGEPSDPLRAAGAEELGNELRSVSETFAERFLLRVDEGSALLSKAREAFVQSLDRNVSPGAIYELSDGILRAGRPSYAIALGLAARPHTRVASHLRSMQTLARALFEVGRARAASTIAIETLPPDLGDTVIARDFLPRWCEILWEAEEWPRLRGTAEMTHARFAPYRGGANEASSAMFFLGMAQARMDTPADARESLSRYVNTQPYEPVPHARVIAFEQLAGISRDAGNEAAELNWLRRGTNLDPLASSGAWLRRARLESGLPGQEVQALSSFANGMRLAQGSTADALVEFESLGASWLLAEARDMDLLLGDQQRQGRYFPPDSENPFELLELARRFEERERNDGVLAITERLLDLYPNFPPAVDLRVRALDSSGRSEGLGELFLERLRLDTGDAASRARLRQLDATGALTPEQRFRLIQIDPRASGTLAFAPQLLARGRADLALRSLQQADQEALGEQGILLFGAAELGRERPARALDAVRPLLASPESAAEALDIAVRAAVALKSTRDLESIFAQVPAELTLDLDSALAAVDTLLAERLPKPALELIERLDSQPSTRDGRVALRLALARLLRREADAAAEALERAEAFRDDGGPDVGRLLLAIELDDWTALPFRVGRVRSSLSEPSDLENCVLSALEERLDEALALALAGEVEHPDEPNWILARLAIQRLRADPAAYPASLGPLAADDARAILIGNVSDPRDPRESLGLLLALEREPWTLWVTADLDAPKRSSPWERYLLARALDHLGLRAEAEGLAAELSREFSRFGPAWALREQLVVDRTGRLDTPELLRLRAAKSEALESSTKNEPSPEQLAAQATVFLERGQVERAVTAASQAAKLAPDDVGVRLLLAELLDENGELARAMGEHATALALAPDPLARELLPEFLERFERSAASRAANEEVLLGTLTAFGTRFPDDPLLAAARARNELRSTDDSYRLRSARALNHLHSFRELTRGRPVGIQQPAAVASWLELYLEFDPFAAESFLLEELGARPDEVDLWLMLGRVYEAQERLPDAIAHYELIHSMVPEPRALLSAARILAELGNDHATVERYTQGVAALESRSADDPDLTFLRARSMINAGPQWFERGVALLDEMWRQRRAIAADVPTEELAYLYGSALLRRGNRSDRTRCVNALEIKLEATTDPLERTLLEALVKLGGQLPLEPEKVD